MPITRETRAIVRAGMAAIVAAADLRVEIGMSAGRGGMDRRVRVADVMTSAGRVRADSVQAGRRKVGGAMIAEAVGIAVVAEAGAILSSSAIVTGSPRRRWCGRRR